VYLKPIEENLKEDAQSTKILTQEQFDALFGNIEEIREVSQSLFSDLQEGCNGQDLHIGKIFLAHVPIPFPPFLIAPTRNYFKKPIFNTIRWQS